MDSWPTLWNGILSRFLSTIFASLVGVWASGDTILSRTIVRAVFFFFISFCTVIFASIVRVKASGDTTPSRTIVRAVLFFRSVCTVIFASLVRVWASGDTTLSRTIVRALSEQFFFPYWFVRKLQLQKFYKQQQFTFLVLWLLLWSGQSMAWHGQQCATWHCRCLINTLLSQPADSSARIALLQPRVMSSIRPISRPTSLKKKELLWK